MHKLSERIVKRTYRSTFRYLNLHQLFGGRKRLKTVKIVMMLLSPLLWLFILVETKKLLKTWNEIYYSDASIEKKGNISNVLFDS